MKKVFCSFFIVCTLLLNVQKVHAVEPVTISIAALGVALGTTLYNAIPNAEYSVYVTGNDGSKYTKASSCDEALGQAITALENGAVKVEIITARATIHKSCYDKTYYPRDIDYLRSRR